MLSAPKHARFPGECTCGMHGCPSGEAGVLGEQSDLERKTPQQWTVVTHIQPLIPQEPPRTPAESQGRRLARQKSLSPSPPGRVYRSAHALDLGFCLGGSPQVINWMD